MEGLLAVFNAVLTSMSHVLQVHELMRQSDADKFMGNGALAEASQSSHHATPHHS